VVYYFRIYFVKGINSLKNIVGSSVACLFVVTALIFFYPGRAQETPLEYFPETGHYISEPFLSFFETTGGLQTWGPPITEAIEENGQLVQYFQRARMECSAEVRDTCEVQLSPLGELLGDRTPRTATVSDSLIRDGLCRYFPDTGHNVCFSFLAFYVDQGGPDMFGPPISEITVEPGIITQYFQRARIEWHMDRPAGASMQLGAIGDEYFRGRGLDASLLLPAESSPAPQPATDHIAVGDYVRVVGTEGTGLRFRTGAGLRHGTTQMLDEGTILRVIGGPEIADDFTWWYLNYQGSLGWCAGAWLERIEAPDSL
jgi:hypothetical protein